MYSGERYTDLCNPCGINRYGGHDQNAYEIKMMYMRQIDDLKN